MYVKRSHIKMPTYMYSVFCLLVIINLCMRNIEGVGFPDGPSSSALDSEKYESGKNEYELIKQRSSSPRYGKCWLNALQIMERSCSELTDVVQSRLALFYLNCFFELTGQDVYKCNEDDVISDCISTMTESSRASYATFFTHTQNICYFLQSQIWHEETERTINKLADNSALVATQLEESSEMQSEMLKQQNQSLDNQQQLMFQATNLSQIITNSSSDIHFMFDEFNKTTQEQRLLIIDVFDRITKLQSLVVGEFTGFYSIIFYTLSILISYMLTSTSRTSGARFYMFTIMTLNILFERIILSWKSTDMVEGEISQDVDDAVLYCRQWWCRQFCSVSALVVLAVCAYRYKDLNIINNQLLVEIRKQNSELKRFLTASGSGSALTVLANGEPGAALVKPIFYPEPSVPAITPNVEKTCDTDSNYSSGSEADSEDSMASDRTFIMDEQNNGDVSESDTESYYMMNRSSRCSTPAMLGELEYLRNSTPIKELSRHAGMNQLRGRNVMSPASRERYQRWSRSTTPVDVRPGIQYYFLRDRVASPARKNPVVNTESPSQFSKTIHRLARIASKNSIFARFTSQKSPRAHDDSSDED